MSKVEFEKLSFSTYDGHSPCQVFLAPADSLRLSTKHHILFGIYGADLSEAGLKAMHVVYEGDARRVLPYKPDTASSLSRLRDKRGRPHPLCTRTLLERIERDLAAQGLRFRVGLEIEFHALHADGSALLDVDLGFANMYSPIITGVAHPAAKLMEEIVRSLRDMDVPVFKYHTESAACQLEIALKPVSPFEAADAVLRVKEVVKDIAMKQGLQASFAPCISPFGRPQKTGIHAHFSIVSDKEHAPIPEDAGVFIAKSLLPEERSFVAGILEHLPALVGITMPHATSYTRLPQLGRFVAWGSEVHMSPMRLCYEIDKDDRPTYHWEYRSLDMTADPHLALAAILSVGGQAVLEKKSLDLPDIADPDGSDRVEFMKAGATLEQAKAAGASRLLPTTLDEALEELERDTKLQQLVGEEIIKTHIGVRRAHAKLFELKENQQKQEYLMRVC